MKRIIKGSEPPDLLKYRLTKGATYADYRPKEPLKKSLLIEQGYICCFCMQRISESNMEIAHWEPIDVNPARQLDYKNHLASCAGNRGSRLALQHCNARQGNTMLTINPADPVRNCEDYIKYRSNGDIYSDDENVQKDLTDTLNLNMESDTLNLNMQTLKANRRNALNTVIEELNKLFPNKNWSKTEIAKKISDWSRKNINGQYPEYCQFVTYILSKRL
ncbi:retron system putative HNH endonuclease [Tumidithrix elongata RA019]|uniref:Retron system putative HNH endonuclease n=1 Tax=Tumidithrix elongata BACA0141 TaxID=2716417 RepID=A0AAW9PXX2_9CYAN|nr:retron system putative HNH endonuclease [Tumidithrix elongata RA019]